MIGRAQGIFQDFETILQETVLHDMMHLLKPKELHNMKNKAWLAQVQGHWFPWVWGLWPYPLQLAPRALPPGQSSALAGCVFSEKVNPPATDFSESGGTGWK